MAYTVGSVVNRQLRMHMLDLMNGGDRVLDLSGGESEGIAMFSPDSSRIVFVTYAGGRSQVNVAPVDGSSKALAMGPSYPDVDGQDISGVFSPDGASVIVNNPATSETRFVDAATGGDGRILPWAADGVAAW